MSRRPNVVLIMVDDMGYSDIGCYGGEIPTPHIDRLAAGGLRFSQFYNTARCCPTRASLMTGLHPHQTGIGGMTNSPKKISDLNQSAYGYTGFLNRDCVTMAEVLKNAGYHTYMAGKWHLGYHRPDRWPLQRGFERFYGILSGACSYLWPHGDRGVTHDNTPVTVEKNSGYYTTDAFTDHAIRFVEEQKDDSPFFLYLAYNAPHWPLHAKTEDIEKFVGKYMRGWDALRTQRRRRMVEMGLIEREWGLSSRDAGARPWDALTDEQKRQLDYRMAVYAAQIHCVDYNVGKLVHTLRRRGQLDNTLILFLSDNGGCAEPYKDLGGGAFADINNPDKGGAISYGQGWANASNTPFRRFKVWVNEGGIATPLIAHWPEAIQKERGRIAHDAGYLIDIMPTVLEVTGTRYPRQYQGHDIHPLEGRSLAPALRGEPLRAHEWMFWEHMGHCAVRHGKWKALKELRDETWGLYDLEADRCETNDVAGRHPDLVNRMAEQWETWARRCHVVPKRWVKMGAGAAETH
jgi:arylsulfatase